jgi:hypothetical protein
VPERLLQGAHAAPSKLDTLNEIRASIRATPGWA